MSFLEMSNIFHFPIQIEMMIGNLIEWSTTSVNVNTTNRCFMYFGSRNRHGYSRRRIMHRSDSNSKVVPKPTQIFDYVYLTALLCVLTAIYNMSYHYIHVHITDNDAFSCTGTALHWLSKRFTSHIIQPYPKHTGRERDLYRSTEWGWNVSILNYVTFKYSLNPFPLSSKSNFLRNMKCTVSEQWYHIC